MKVEIVKYQLLPEVPSASGIVIHQGSIYIVGDDSAYLYQLNEAWQVVNTIEQFDTRLPAGAKMPKLLKADLEVLTSVNWHGRQMLLSMGSGSKSPERDRGYLYLPDTEEKQNKILTLNLTPYYTFIKENFDVQELNIEGAAVDGDSLYLVHRGNLNGKNWMFQYPVDAFISHTLGQSDYAPVPTAHLFNFELNNNIEQGFADLAMLQPGLLAFSTTLEDTDSAYEDGAIAGSYIGVLKQQIDGSFVSNSTIVNKDGIVLKEKIEGITLQSKIDNNNYELLAVTDNDEKPSTIMKLHLIL